jgi:hypothetical protein
MKISSANSFILLTVFLFLILACGQSENTNKIITEKSSEPVSFTSYDSNLALNRPYTLQPNPNEEYPDIQGHVLTDGKRAQANQLQGGWVGFNQGNPKITLDLKSIYEVQKIKVGFLFNEKAGVRLPKSVKLWASLDGANWVSGGELSNHKDESSTFYLNTPGLNARYIQVEPDRTGWLFMDEVEVFGNPAEKVSVNQAVRNILFITNQTKEYDQSRVRMTNLLDGMGFPYNMISLEEIETRDLTHYQLIIVAGSSKQKLSLPSTAEKKIVNALHKGVNVLWIGRGIWGGFKTTNLPDAFGLRYLDQGWSLDMGIAKAQFKNLDNNVELLKVHKEIVYKTEPVNGSVEEWYAGSDGNILNIPFIIRNQASSQSGKAVFISLSLLDLWKSTEAEDTFARAEVLSKYIYELVGDGIVGKHPVLDGKDAVFIMRLEDYTPGGREMGHTQRTWLIRMKRLIELMKENNLPLNIALVPKYAHPFLNEYRDWDDKDPSIRMLKNLADQAFKNGGSLLVHGFKHQNGSGPDDFSGDDWEMWDEDAKTFLPLDAQKQIIKSAYTEVKDKWRIKPKIWETPHYSSNADTYIAAKASGFIYVNESDTMLFPNRYGYKNLIAGNLLNLPETAFYFPINPEEVRKTTIIKQKHVLPRMVRLKGAFTVFFHNTWNYQFAALENLLKTASRYDLWKPNLEDYGKFWEDRERVQINSQIDSSQRKIIVDVRSGFKGLALRVRLPDGMAPKTVGINGKRVEAKSNQKDGIWFISPVLTEKKDSQVIIQFKKNGVQAETLPAIKGKQLIKARF